MSDISVIGYSEKLLISLIENVSRIETAGMRMWGCQFFGLLINLSLRYSVAREMLRLFAAFSMSPPV